MAMKSPLEQKRLHMIRLRMIRNIALILALCFIGMEALMIFYPPPHAFALTFLSALVAISLLILQYYAMVRFIEVRRAFTQMQIQEEARR